MQVERRQFPRSTLEKVIYIHLEPDNGGIILNVSDEGFCFHSVGPIHHTGRVTFWLSIGVKDRIQGSGELVWTDHTKKTGAMRLTMPEAERRRFRSWVGQTVGSANPRINDQPDAAVAPVVTAASAAEAPATVASAMASALAPAAPVEPATAATDSAVAAEVPPTTNSEAVPRNLRPIIRNQRPLRRRPFRTLWSRLDPDSVGAFVSASTLAVALVLFFTHLPRLGYRPLARIARTAKRGEANAKSAAPPETSRTDSDPVLPVSSYQVTPASLAKLSSEIAGLDDYRDSEETRVSTQAKYAAPVEPPGVRSIVLASTESSPAQSDSISATAYQQGGHPLSSIDSSATDSVYSEAATDDTVSLKFLDAGSFKSFLMADDTTDGLSRMGFRAIIVHKGHLWMSSYHVLVGPFENGNDVEAAKEKLVTRGLTPRQAKP